MPYLNTSKEVISMNSLVEYRDRIERALKKIAPGALAVLNMLAQKHYNRSYIDLLAEPCLPAVKKLLETIYDKRASLETAICIFVSRPLIEALHLSIEPRQLTELILNEKWGETYKVLGLQMRATTPMPGEYSNILVCSYAIELIAARAYDILSRATEDPLVAGISRYISNESREHAYAVKLLGEVINVTVPDSLDKALTLCSDAHVRDYARLLNELEEKLASTEVSIPEIANYFDKLAGLERIAGEERYMRTMMPLITMLVSDEKRTIIRRLVDLIVCDEEHHEELAKTIAEYLRSKETS